jgi:hypothetical protein
LRRLLSAVFLLLLLATAFQGISGATAQSSPLVYVTSQYTLNRYGFATVNETVQFVNGGGSTLAAPGLTFGLGNLSSDVVDYNLTGSGFSVSAAGTSGPYTITGSVLPGNASRYVLSFLLNGVVTSEKNGSFEALVLSNPSLSAAVTRLLDVVQMPASTAFVSPPMGLKGTFSGTNNTYSAIPSSTGPVTAQTSVRALENEAGEDFNPLVVYYASREISVGSGGKPLVTDTIEFLNMGTMTLSTLYVVPLTGPSATVTILAQAEPRLIPSFSLSLSSDSIDLTSFAEGYPNGGIPAGANFTLSFQYALAGQYYSISGDQVTLNLPDSPPVPTFVDSYSIVISVPVGVSVVQGAPQAMSDVSPWQQGTTKLSYALSTAWGVDVGIPTASVIFAILLFGLFVSRTKATLEEETEEESSTEIATAMINAFDEKTNLINSLWPEISGKDPNEFEKAYFDELRGRLDSFRGRAIQRLNEARQKSTSQRFTELLNQIQGTEREVDRASKDKLNLYEQFYLRRMRKEVYDRLLPQYTKRLERALNILSDELHLVQREAKLL